MISVIVYGRNDSFGYNLPKRAAISFNCIAHLLDHEDDEIIFVDCNTPNDLPTFPESIADTLTPRARKLLRVLRLRPEQYEKGKNGSKFKVQEPLCRNIAIRRSNPANRWILSTNTDMVFTPLEDGVSLSRMVSQLPDGFYELPRFEIPESLWESIDRQDPAAIINSFRRWGLRLHLDAIVTASPETLFDAPGDFQLALRSQMFDIGGMNEQMVQCRWHVDSNLARRMWLLNGETKTIFDRLHAFHCDHSRVQTAYQAADSVSGNSLEEYFVNVTTPYLPEQAASWGLPGEKIEEVGVDTDDLNRFSSVLERLLPGMDKPISGKNTVTAFDSGLFYDNFHLFPYLASIIVNLPLHACIGYLGCNMQMLALLSNLRRLLGHTGEICYCNDATPPSLPLCRPVPREELYTVAAAIIIDLSMKHLPARFNERGLPIPDKCPEVVQFSQSMSQVILEVARYEKGVADNGGVVRPVIFVGCHYTTFDDAIMHLFDCTMTPASTHIRSGFIAKRAFDSMPPLFPVHFYVVGDDIADRATWISSHFGRPVTHEQVRMAETFYKMLLEAKSQQSMLDALETLLSFDAGRGWLQMQIEIAGINGVPEQGEALRKCIEGYQKRWHAQAQ